MDVSVGLSSKLQVLVLRYSCPMLPVKYTSKNCISMLRMKVIPTQFYPAKDEEPYWHWWHKPLLAVHVSVALSGKLQVLELHYSCPMLPVRYRSKIAQRWLKWWSFALCSQHLQGEPRSKEWIYCFHASVLLALNTLKLLRLHLTIYMPCMSCVHIWACDLGSPCKWQIQAKSE